MAIVASLFAGAFGRLLGPRKGAVAAVLGINVYTILVGDNAGLVRAAIMGGLAVYARQHGLNNLSIIPLVMALFNPSIYNPSFDI